MSLRNEIISYISAQYGAEAEYPWKSYRNYCVFRRKDSGKWFAIIMDISSGKLGLEGEGKTDIIDLKTGKMQCANAGHEYPLLMPAGGDFEYVKDKHGLALAAMKGMRYKEYELQLNPGDRLFVYTDGIPEAIDENVKPYGPERLVRILNKVKNESISAVLPAVREDIAAFTGDADEFDDITMLGLVYHGAGNGSNS